MEGYPPDTLTFTIRNSSRNVCTTTDRKFCVMFGRTSNCSISGNVLFCCFGNFQQWDAVVYSLIGGLGNDSPLLNTKDLKIAGRICVILYDGLGKPFTVIDENTSITKF